MTNFVLIDVKLVEKTQFELREDMKFHFRFVSDIQFLVDQLLQ